MDEKTIPLSADFNGAKISGQHGNFGIDISCPTIHARQVHGKVLTRRTFRRRAESWSQTSVQSCNAIVSFGREWCTPENISKHTYACTRSWELLHHHLNNIINYNQHIFGLACFYSFAAMISLLSFITTFYHDADDRRFYNVPGHANSQLSNIATQHKVFLLMLHAATFETYSHA